ncbi:Uncharacterized protein dnl_41010 [Desulfonema limicola]|uniref:Uncharacterized protein n=1 Tax=Desulfonema limicola TaxID=45656 RepID=A0A975BAK2_9BACT|nr:Uncharacterized protein dnl_41010 [Desulfonema limicola]
MSRILLSIHITGNFENLKSNHCAIIDKFKKSDKYIIINPLKSAKWSR